MKESPCTFLEMPWEKQAGYLQHLPMKDLEVLWFVLQEHADALDRLKIAVYSILRDLYEARNAKITEVRP